MMYKWFDHLKEQGYGTVAFVIMPNHVHTIHYFPKPGFNLNKIIGNAKRFMAYEIIKRPEQVHEQDTLNYLASVVTGKEKKKGQLLPPWLVSTKDRPDESLKASELLN